MTEEQVLINHIQEYLDSGMWQYEACYLNKNDLKVIIRALEQEPKTGHWIKIEPYPMMEHEYKCSECYNGTDDPFEKYCSECGVKMEVEDV